MKKWLSFLTLYPIQVKPQIFVVLFISSRKIIREWKAKNWPRNGFFFRLQIFLLKILVYLVFFLVSYSYFSKCLIPGLGARNETLLENMNKSLRKETNYSTGKKRTLMLTFKSESCLFEILQTWCKLDSGTLLTVFREYSDLRLVYQNITLSWQHWNFIAIKGQQDLNWLISISSTSMFIISQLKNRDVYTLC